jgi:endonuclease YncB( thermonuclease family)
MLIDPIKKQPKVLTGVLIKGKRFTLWLVLLLALASLPVAYAVEKQRVVRVIDGDTVVLESGEKVRLLGINTPELGFRGKPVEAGALAAQSLLKQWVLNKTVSMIHDVERKDHYGRTLAHLFIEGGEHINALMLQSGLAALSLHPPNLKYSAELSFAQHAAEKAKRGIWGMAEYSVQSASVISVEKIKKWGRFDGRISKTKSSKKGTKLWLNAKTYIWISENNRRYFPNLNSYEGKTIEARGWPRKWGKNWSINAIHPSQLLLKP